ncbi:MAG: aminotransferase class V-fold PLP-dependent enzyme [Solirubrobacteraceae bacterium]
MELSGLRAEFPVLAEVAYLNAGTDGPLPAAAAHAARQELDRELAEGRATAHFERRRELGEQLRAAYARALGCEPGDLALTTSTSEGLAQVISGLRLGRGDEIVTSEEEHPGLLGALGAVRELDGVAVRMVPFAQLAEAVGPRTRLVACSHVSWVNGALAPAALGELGVPVVLDGAQGLGAVPVEPSLLGCDAYAGSGQKWMCGPDGLGVLWTGPALRERLAVTRRGYGTLADPNAGLDATVHAEGRRFDAPALSAEALACALAAAQVLERAGWAAVHERGRKLAARLAELLAAAGREVAPRGPSTLVSFRVEDPEGERLRLSARGVIVRNIPDRPWLRASVGAWNDEHDLERLVGTLEQ